MKYTIEQLQFENEEEMLDYCYDLSLGLDPGCGENYGVEEYGLEQHLKNLEESYTKKC